MKLFLTLSPIVVLALVGQAVTFANPSGNTMAAPIASLSAPLSAKFCYDVCDLDLIYQTEKDGFFFSLPRATVEAQFSGVAFDNKVPYTPEESRLLREDIRGIWQSILESNPIQSGLAVITAGAPGSGKTTALLNDRRAVTASSGRNWAYIDPDDVCLKQMSRTYQAEVKARLAAGESAFDAMKAAYNKWRPGSNAATNVILANLIREKFAFYYGTTSSSPFSGKFMEFIQSKGYEIRLMHLSAPDAERWKAIARRDEGFVQTTEADTLNKGNDVPQRISDTYTKYAAQIDFLYRPTFDAQAIRAATWVKAPVTAADRAPAIIGTLTIDDAAAYKGVKAIQDTVAAKLGKPELTFEAAVESKSKLSE